jgi:formate hydrogenlyase subunit 5
VTGAPPLVRVAPAELAVTVAAEVGRGGRFAALIGCAHDDGSTALHAVVARGRALSTITTELRPGASSYPALSPLVPAAAWYEREVHDLFGVVPSGHRRADPLVLPLTEGALRPRPGAAQRPTRVDLDVAGLPSHVMGEGVFTIPYGPVRSGVFESVQYLVETVGEEIPHVRTRVYHKHRGIERRFQELSPADGVLLAERIEGTAAVAHALAFSQALEALAGTAVPRRAALLRVVHAELERITTHLDSVLRHTEGAGQAVANARLAVDKERFMRLRARLCGHRFGRGVIVPGGTSGPPVLAPAQALAELGSFARALRDDLDALMATPSFLDRLRGTGVVPGDVARAHGALGPVGRGSGLSEDVRAERPYAAYGSLGFDVSTGHFEGDALARQRVRLDEIGQSIHLTREALDELDEAGDGPWRVDVPLVDGTSLTSVEAPQGELLYFVETSGGRLARVKPRTASFHNLALFHEAFRGDIFTDFVFIEASFGVSMAGVSG